MDSTDHIMPPEGLTYDFYEQPNGEWWDAAGNIVNPRAATGVLNLTFLEGEDFNPSALAEVVAQRKYDSISDLMDAVEAKRRELGL